MNAQQQPQPLVGRPRRGASRAGERAPGILAKHRWLVPLLFVALLCAAIEMGVSAFGEVANVPIRQVSVNGDFRFLDKARIEKSMLPHLGTGFFMVNLPQIRAELERMPLVHEVTVRRAWPDRLLVFITEQVPVLRFGADGYLNPYAEVFRPDEPLAAPGLPMVDGPPGSEKLLLIVRRRDLLLINPQAHRWMAIGGCNNGGELLWPGLANLFEQPLGQTCLLCRGQIFQQ